MRRVHPAIAELQRRNRAAGRRLSPIDENRQNRHTHPHSDTNNTTNTNTNTNNNNNNNNTNNNRNIRRISPQTQGRRTSSASAVHAASVRSQPKCAENRPNMPSRFTSTAPAGGVNDNNRMKRDESRGRNINGTNRIAPRPPMRHLPTKPRSSIYTMADHKIPNSDDNLIPSGNSNPSGEPQVTPADSVTNPTRNAEKFEAVPNSRIFNDSYSVASNSRTRLGFAKNSSFSSRSGMSRVHYALDNDDNEEDEMKSITECADPDNWNHLLPDPVVDLLDGEKLENPFTTDLWANAQDAEKLKISGYYACIRCHVPVVSPTYQVNYPVRGMAAFARFNKEALAVHVAYISTAATFGALKHDSLELHMRCVCCKGFLGILAPNFDLDLPGDLAHVFVVNSSCLRFVKGGRTRCHLDGIYDIKDDSDDGVKTETSSKGADMDFDDLDIFDLSPTSNR
ncbi:uncharacterized protein TM35_000123170 [Trypanosoma theileri]|uniref:MsrB domain-containing protein n=1 Tax=Trypanosoma theileri TaxID=67003 RepID=A0A1X0NXY9_9TRYP|nr:uncharacterized protein TM35_000123170 [Trypanosoma theileri]ORC89542.1 hypothetical protein TM35_000123170 [Trypanosoma theileri]